MEPEQKPNKIYKSTLKSSVLKSSANVRTSQIFFNVADEEMSGYFMGNIQEEEESEYQNNQNENSKQKDENKHKEGNGKKSDFIECNTLDEEEQKEEPTSRLEIEMEKNNLLFTPVYGEIFIMIIDTELIGSINKEQGKILVTNYRFVFFKGEIRKLDLPFGFIEECKFQKNQIFIAYLKYDHFWKLRIVSLKDYERLNIFLQIYLKVDTISSAFAFAYALKYPEFEKIKHPLIVNEFVRLGLPQQSHLHLLENPNFSFCDSYPEFYYLPKRVNIAMLKRVADFWNLSRFPILSYLHMNGNTFIGVLWRSSNLICERNENLGEVGKYLTFLIKETNQKLNVYDCGFRQGKKGIEEFELNSECSMNYLEIETLQSIKTAYRSIIQCFLNPKKSFIKDLLASKWYDIVLQYLKGALEISNKLQSQSNVLLKCLDGRDKSSVVSALVQLILHPFYRTFKGFAYLVEKEFKFFGHPFLKRFGLTSDKSEEIPIFIMFLDCVCQLIHANEMCFEYNFKYLSKLSNLMYSTLFGTFITNCRKEALYFHVDLETIPIWEELESELTKNAFYRQKTGTLEVPLKFDDIRIWKEHFWYLTTAPKETYQIHPMAEVNQDYVGLNCQKIMVDNEHLKEEVVEQKKILDDLKQRIKEKEKQNENK